MVPIADACVHFSKSSAIEASQKQLRHLISQCHAVARERDRDINDIDHRRTSIIQTLLQTKQKIFEKVEKLVSRVTNELDRIYAIEKLEMKNHLLSLKEMASGLEERVASVEASKKDQSELKLFIAVQNATDKHKKMASALGHIHDEAHKVYLKFEPNKSVENAMDALTSIGDIVLNTKEYRIIPKPKKMLQPGLTTVNNTEPEEYKIRKHVNEKRAKAQGEINIRDKEDLETCWITGMVVLKDSSLIVADNNNNRIKLLGPSHQILNSINLSTPPFDIALLNQSEAVYTLPDVKQIQFIQIVGQSDLKYGSALKLDFDCNGISTLRENLIVTSITEKLARLINIKGEVIWTAFTDTCGNKLFEWPWYVETNKESNKIYISDRGKSTITTLDGNGKVMSVRDVRGKGPRGIVLDDVGNMYVCHYMTDELEIISTDYARDRRVLLAKQDGIKHPQSLCYDEEKGQLLLSANNSDFVSVFQMN